MNGERELADLRRAIAETVAEREALKRAIESGEVAAGPGLRSLEAVDARLSRLDSRFKTLWDREHGRS